MSDKLYVILYLLFLIVLSSFTYATTFTNQPAAANGSDTFVDQIGGTENYGTAVVMNCLPGATPSYIWINGSYVCHSIPSGSTISLVNLSLKNTDSAGNSAPSLAYPSLNVWTEMGITYNNMPSVNTSWNLVISESNMYTLYEWGTISLNLTWFQNQCQCVWDGTANCSNGFELRNSNKRNQYSTSDTSDPDNRPKWTVVYSYSGSGISQTVAPTIENPTPVDGYVSNINITLNVSHPTINNDVRYYLYLSTSSTLNESHLYLNNVTRTAEEYKNFTTNLSIDGTYYYKWKVQNISNGIFSANTTQRNFVIDTTIPILTLRGGNSFNSSNMSSTNQFENYIYFNITATDETSLFGFLINVTKDGTSYYSYINESFGYGNKTFNFTSNVSTSSWSAGVYDIEVSTSDSHTSKSINEYDVSSFLGKLTFDTAEKNHIEISGDGAYSARYIKQIDRYEFGFDYLLPDTTRTFTIKSANKIYYLPKSIYKGHFVIPSGNKLEANWIDFEGIDGSYTVKKINDKEYDVIFTNLEPSKTVLAKSLGGVNIVTKNYKWYKGTYSITSENQAFSGETELFVLNMSSNSSYLTLNATFYYNNTFYSNTKTTGNNYTSFSTSLIIPPIISDSENVSFYWAIDVTQNDGGVYSFNIIDSLNVSESRIGNCTGVYIYKVLKISGRDEETNVAVNLSINFYIFSSTGEIQVINSSFSWRGNSSYYFCVSENNTQYQVDSIIEYGDGAIYSHRTYYLNNLTINTSTIPELFLYHLNNSKASEIVFTVFDTITGNKIQSAYIKILRYYPGENVYRIVEISKTDETGKSLGKMVLADVFYKFIIEQPAGIVKLSTDVLRILSLTRSFGITFVTNYLDTWNKINDVSISTTCTKGTKTCRVTWSDSSNIIQDVTLEVWRTNGLNDEMIYTHADSGAAGTISYTIVESTLGNNYEARSYIESNTETSRYNGGVAGLIFPDSPFWNNTTDRKASLFPLFLLVVVIVFTLVDLGVAGITIGALLGLLVGSMTGIIPLSPFYFVSFIIITIILLYKLSR